MGPRKVFLRHWQGPSRNEVQIGVPRNDFVRMSHAESKVWDSAADPADPPDPPDQVSGSAFRDLTSSRAGGQDDGSLTDSLKSVMIHSGK